MRAAARRGSFRLQRAHIALHGNFRPVDILAGIETNKAVTEVDTVYDIAPSRTPLLVSMTNRCLLVGSARRRHSTLRLFHGKPGRHLSFSRVCAPSNRSDNAFALLSFRKKSTHTSPEKYFAEIRYLATNIDQSVNQHVLMIISHVFLFDSLCFNTYFNIDKIVLKERNTFNCDSIEICYHRAASQLIAACRTRCSKFYSLYLQSVERCETQCSAFREVFTWLKPVKDPS